MDPEAGAHPKRARFADRDIVAPRGSGLPRIVLDALILTRDDGETSPAIHTPVSQ